MMDAGWMEWTEMSHFWSTIIAAQDTAATSAKKKPAPESVRVSTDCFPPDFSKTSPAIITSVPSTRGERNGLAEPDRGDRGDEEGVAGSGSYSPADADHLDRTEVGEIADDVADEDADEDDGEIGERVRPPDGHADSSMTKKSAAPTKPKVRAAPISEWLIRASPFSERRPRASTRLRAQQYKTPARYTMESSSVRWTTEYRCDIARNDSTETLFRVAEAKDGKRMCEKGIASLVFFTERGGDLWYNPG